MFMSNLRLVKCADILTILVLNMGQDAVKQGKKNFLLICGVSYFLKLRVLGKSILWYFHK